MKRNTLLAIAVLGAAAAIVVVTTGASAGTAGRADQPSDGFAGFVACLASHGVHVPSDDPASVKQWLGEHPQDDPAVQAAVNACAGTDGAGGAKGDKNGAEPDLTPAQLVACLEQHRVDVPSNVQAAPDTLKQWLVGVMDQPTVQSAVDDCTSSSPPSGQKK